jgi:hypothetical protein
VALLLLAGCAQTLRVQVPALLPARVPVYVFASVWVAAGTDEDEAYLADRLAAHLARNPQREVRRVDLAELEPARLAGEIPASTVVVLLDLSLDHAMRRYWDTVPMQFCGYYGCFMSYQSYSSAQPEVSGVVALSVYEGPTARALQRERFTAEALGWSSRDAKADTLDQLALRLERAVGVLRTRYTFEVFRVKQPDVEAALDAFAKGDFRAAEQHLERATDGMGPADPEVQARVWYDLGIARWAVSEPSALTTARLDAAQQALAKAAALDDRPFYQSALRRLAAARERHRVLGDQQRARSHNFSLPKPEAEEPAEAEDSEGDD